MDAKWIKYSFGASAIYDGLLAIGFMFFAPMLFDYYGIEHPNHMGYLHFPAALLVVFAFLLWRIAQNPTKNSNLIPYAIGLKISYCGVVLYHKFADSIPAMWVPFAWIDFVFLILFVVAWRNIRSSKPAGA